MQITWYGHSCFRIAAKGDSIAMSPEVGNDVVIVIDPYGKEIGLTPPRFKADVVLVSHDHPDHNHKEPFKDAFIIREPGEYEVRGITIKGINAFHDAKEGKERGSTILFRFAAEGLRVAHLGDVGQEKLTNEQIEALGDIDILFVPVGGKYTIGADEAQDIVGQIEPRLVVPMHYKTPGSKVDVAGIEPFLKGMGASGVKALDKLTIKARDLTSQETKVVALVPVR